jgi:hypothetical protein
VRDRYSILAGLLLVAVIVIAMLNHAGQNADTLGLERQPLHWALPEFAVPVAAGQLEGDANVAQDDCSTAELPCPPSARRTPACQVQGPDVIRVCDLFDRPSVISFWFSMGGNCVDQQDVVSAVFERYRDRVNFLSLDVRDSRDTLRGLVREHGWKMPVGFDRDGAVATLYRVGGCPTFAYVYPGGTLQGASGRELSASQLGSRIEALLRSTQAVEAKGP